MAHAAEVQRVDDRTDAGQVDVAPATPIIWP
jgi:hypothetical protein